MKGRTMLLVGGGAAALLLLLGRKKAEQLTELGDIDVPIEDPLVLPPISSGIVAAKLYDDLLRPLPEIGFLYEVKKGDNLAHIAAQAMGQNSANYQRAIAGASWNVALYGNEARPEQTTGTAEIEGREVSIEPAFLPNNRNVRELLLEGPTLERAAKWKRTSKGATKYFGIGDSYGTIWLPPLGDGSPIVWSWASPEGMPAPIVTLVPGFEGLALPYPWEG